MLWPYAEICSAKNKSRLFFEFFSPDSCRILAISLWIRCVFLSDLGFVLKPRSPRVFYSSHFSKCQGIAVHHCHCLSAFMLKNATIWAGGGDRCGTLLSRGVCLSLSGRMTTE